MEILAGNPPKEPGPAPEPEPLQSVDLIFEKGVLTRIVTKPADYTGPLTIKVVE
jgi:hypothetical protein